MKENENSADRNVKGQMLKIEITMIKFFFRLKCSCVMHIDILKNYLILNMIEF